MISFMTQTVTVVHPAMLDDRGTLVPDWDAEPAGTEVVPGCSVQPGATAEVLEARQASSVRWTVLMPLTPSLTEYDGMRLADGVLYQVSGRPDRWASPTGALDHTVAYLVDWSG